jgi:hypothetical protein
MDEQGQRQSLRRRETQTAGSHISAGHSSGEQTELNEEPNPEPLGEQGREQRET